MVLPPDDVTFEMFQRFVDQLPLVPSKLIVIMSGSTLLVEIEIDAADECEGPPWSALVEADAWRFCDEAFGDAVHTTVLVR